MKSELFLMARSCSSDDLVRSRCCSAFSASRSFIFSWSTVSLISATSSTNLTAPKREVKYAAFFCPFEKTVHGERASFTQIREHAWCGIGSVAHFRGSAQRSPASGKSGFLSLCRDAGKPRQTTWRTWTVLDPCTPRCLVSLCESQGDSAQPALGLLCPECISSAILCSSPCQRSPEEPRNQTQMQFLSTKRGTINW